MNGPKMLLPHWDAAGALAAYRGERETVRRSHLQVIWLLLSGEAPSAVARVTGFSERWIEKLVARWNAEGAGRIGRSAARQWRQSGSGRGRVDRLGGGAG